MAALQQTPFTGPVLNAYIICTCPLSSPHRRIRSPFVIFASWEDIDSINLDIHFLRDLLFEPARPAVNRARCTITAAVFCCCLALSYDGLDQHPHPTMLTRPSGPPPKRGSQPTQMLLRPSERSDAEIVDLDLSKIDENPITFFLTPAQRLYDDDDTMDFEMEFDAGIEDAKHPPPIVRSISPSSLGGIGLPPPPRLPTPPSRSQSPDIDRDMPRTPEDHEDYMYLASREDSHSFSFPLSLRDLATGRLKTQEKRATDGMGTLSFPSPQGSSRERAKTRVKRGRPRTAAFRRSPHAWREPSPDVWSIEEETEAELNSDTGDSAVEDTDLAKNNGIDIPAAKPKKRVRFALPDE